MAPPDSPRETALALPRRSVLDAILGVGVASSALAAFYPLTRFLVPPEGADASTSSVVAARLAELRPNSGLVFPFGNRPAIVVRTTEGDLKAFSAVCSHLECTVQYRSDTGQIWCACHNGTYDLSGNVVSGPPPRPLEAFTVAVRGDPGHEEIVVSRG